MDLKMNGKAESQSTKSRRDGKKRMKDKRRVMGGGEFL